MAKIVNNDKLTLILTHYGTTRVAEALADSTLNLNITKIKLGSGDNYEYYTPDISQEELKGPLDLEFYIYDKELLEDKETVSFHTIIPENVGGFDIREVGLYETVDGEDKLFAISTQQPFVKPSTADNYFINIDYYIFLKIANFADIYDQIVLDTEHALVTQPNFEELLRTFLFAHGNLINQIGNNSRIIGYNRATQLYEKITEDKESFSYISLYKNYASLVDYVSSPDKIFSYWAFDYSRRQSLQNSIVDISPNKYYLSSNKASTNYTRNYHGFMSTLDFSSPNYFSLTSQIPLGLYNIETMSDTSFTMIFALNPLSKATRTLIAKSDYATSSHSFEIKELSDRSLFVRLFSDAANYVTFTSAPNTIPDGCHSIVLTYDSQTSEMYAFINSEKYNLERVETGNYTYMNEVPKRLYCYEYEPSFSIYTNYNKTQFVDSFGAPYADTTGFWSLSDTKVYFDGTEIENSTQQTIPPLYAWKPDNDLINTYIWTTQETFTDADVDFYNEDRSLNNSDLYDVQYVDGEYKPFYDFNTPLIRANDHDQTSSETLKVFLYTKTLEKQLIYTNNTSNPTVLYDQDGKVYSENPPKWKIQNKKIYYIDRSSGTEQSILATRDSVDDIIGYTPDLTSYIINSYGRPSEYINAEVGLISIVKEKMPEEFARIIALNLCATMGKNPYISGS